MAACKILRSSPSSLHPATLPQSANMVKPTMWKKMLGAVSAYLGANSGFWRCQGQIVATLWHQIKQKTSWWFQPIWKILVKMDRFPR